MACVLEDFRSRQCVCPAVNQSVLWNCGYGVVDDVVDCLDDHPCAKLHKSVVNGAYVVSDGYVYFFLLDNVAGVDFVLEEECCHAGFLLAVDHSPVDRSCATVFWK